MERKSSSFTERKNPRKSFSWNLLVTVAHSSGRVDSVAAGEWLNEGHSVHKFLKVLVDYYNITVLTCWSLKSFNWFCSHLNTVAKFKALTGGIKSTLCQSQLFPPVRDYEFGFSLYFLLVYSSTKWGCYQLINRTPRKLSSSMDSTIPLVMIIVKTTFWVGTACPDKKKLQKIVNRIEIPSSVLLVLETLKPVQ